MSFIDKIAVLILTYNEAPNIARTLDALRRFPDILVLDSGSTDETLEILSRYANVRAETRPFDCHAAQWSHGLSLCAGDRAWVLALDADYLLPEALVDEIDGLCPSAGVAGYRLGFRYLVFGRPLSGTLYPPVVALYRRDAARYVQDGHTQRTVVDGQIADLLGRIDHDDRKSLARWFSSQQTYAKLEADHLLGAARKDLKLADRIRLMAWPAPILVFFHVFIVKRCILDGWPGWLYVLQRALAEIMLALEIIDRRARGYAAR